MKRTFIALFFIPIFAQAQQRIDRPYAKLSEPLSSLTAATGWVKDENDRWISRQNRIAVDFSGQSAKLIDYEKYKPGFDNFIYYQFRKFIYQNDTSIVFIKKYKDGYYRYDKIEEDWVDVNNCLYWLIDPKEMNSVHIYNDTIDHIQIPIKEYQYTGHIYPGESELTKIKSDYKPYENTGSLVINYQSFKKTGKVWFTIFSTSYSSIDGYNSEIDNEKVFPSSYQNFDRCYYETDFATFKKLFAFSIK